IICGLLLKQPPSLKVIDPTSVNSQFMLNKNMSERKKPYKILVIVNNSKSVLTKQCRSENNNQLSMNEASSLMMQLLKFSLVKY
ncbi:hypothetical protein EWB00_000998, partial [Schistosoma japonicum]